jgi:hypothetical protein
VSVYAQSLCYFDDAEAVELQQESSKLVCARPKVRRKSATVLVGAPLYNQAATTSCLHWE